MLRTLLKMNGIVSLMLVTAFTISTMGAIVNDNDGAAFITKAEFESLKNEFQVEIDQYNKSLDNKINGIIANYLDGLIIKKIVKIDPYVSNYSVLRFYNFPNRPLTNFLSDFDTAKVYENNIIGESNAIHHIMGVDFWAHDYSEMLPKSYLYAGLAPMYRYWSSTSFLTGSWRVAAWFGYHGSYGQSFWSASSGWLNRTQYYTLKLSGADSWIDNAHNGFISNIACLIKRTNSRNVAVAIYPWIQVGFQPGFERLSPVLYAPGTQYLWGYNYSRYPINWGIYSCTSSRWYFSVIDNFNSVSVASASLDLDSHIILRKMLWLGAANASVTSGTNGSALNFSIDPRSASWVNFSGESDDWIRSALFVNPMVSWNIGAYPTAIGVSFSGGYPYHQLFDTSNRVTFQFSFAGSAVMYAPSTFWSFMASSGSALGLTPAIPVESTVTSIVVSLPKADKIKFRDLYNEYLAVSGVYVHMTDGLPIFVAKNTGTMHLKLSAVTVGYSIYQSAFTVRIYHSGSISSCKLHLNIGAFGSATGNGSTLKLATSSGDETSSYAQNLDWNSDHAWDLYINVKEGDIIYCKLDTQDSKGLSYARLTKAVAEIETSG